jgi:hypothetical protein
VARVSVTLPFAQLASSHLIALLVTGVPLSDSAAVVSRAPPYACPVIT